MLEEYRSSVRRRNAEDLQVVTVVRGDVVGLDLKSVLSYDFRLKIQLGVRVIGGINVIDVPLTTSISASVLS